MFSSKRLRTILVYILLYFITCFIGWCFESVYVSIKFGHIVNRGFLYGPCLPIYGYGALLLLPLSKFEKHPLIIFFLSMIISGILEYFTGYFMFQIWNQRWWNYTNDFLNINGFVCLRSVISFGLASIILIYFLKPFSINIMNKFSTIQLSYITSIFMLLYLIDNILSFLIRHPL